MGMADVLCLNIIFEIGHVSYVIILRILGCYYVWLLSV